MSDGVRSGNCISYGGHACCRSSAQRGITVVTRETVAYGLLTYVGTRGSSASSLK